MDANVLLILPAHRRSTLLKQLEGDRLQIFEASNIHEAQRQLSGQTSYDLLLTDSELPDGSWQDVWQFVQDSPRPCEMIVCPRCGDEELWAEVLQCGGYDLLVEPYEPNEVHRIIENALDSQYMRRFSRMATAVRA